jgi:hypothetical protein
VIPTCVGKSIFPSFAHASSTGTPAGDFECELGLLFICLPSVTYFLPYNYTELSGDIFGEFSLSENILPSNIALVDVFDWLFPISDILVYLLPDFMVPSFQKIRL